MMLDAKISELQSKGQSGQSVSDALDFMREELYPDTAAAERED